MPEDIFSPPSAVPDGHEYKYGNVTWVYNAASGVWNISGGSFVGAQGPEGPVGSIGPTGPTGNPVTGDSGAFVVVQGGGTGTVRVATAGASGVAAFPSADFGVSVTGTVSLTGNVARTNLANRFTQTNSFVSGLTAGSTITTFSSFQAKNSQDSKTITIASGIDPSTEDQYWNYISSAADELNIFSPTCSVKTTSAGIRFGANAYTYLFNNYQDAFSGEVPAIYNTSAQIGIQYTDGGGNPYYGYLKSAALSANRTYALPNRSGTIALTDQMVSSFNGGTGSITVTGSQHGVPFINTNFNSVGGLTASTTLLFNGTSLTFGSTTSTFTVTGPNMILGAATQITGGVFRNPAEYAPHYQLDAGVNDVVVNGASGSIQRYTITPNNTVTIKAGTSWNDYTGAVETIAVIIQNKSGRTGQFDPSIITDGLVRPILLAPDTATNYGVTGGVTMLTLMRTNLGSSKGLTMGFVVSGGMTGSNLVIN